MGEPITLINVFEVPAHRADEFVESWRRRAEAMSRAPGFLDSALHRALSGEARFQFVNVSHWATSEAWQAAVARPEFQALVRALPPEFRRGANPAAYRPVVRFG